jgi:hypothetical protein
LTAISPSRAAAPSLAATRNATLPLPWPDAGEIPDNHVAELVAVHAHSGCVVTLKVLLPPSATTSGGVLTVT